MPQKTITIKFSLFYFLHITKWIQIYAYIGEHSKIKTVYYISIHIKLEKNKYNYKYKSGIENDKKKVKICSYKLVLYNFIRTRYIYHKKNIRISNHILCSINVCIFW